MAHAKKYSYPLVLFFILASCKNVNEQVLLDASNPKLVLENGILHHQGSPFNGLLTTTYADGRKKSTVIYDNGRKNGSEEQWYPNGSMASMRTYSNGKKTGTHKGWWDNGKLKFLYHFNDLGEYDGEVKEWYASGQKYKAFNYEDGKEVGSQKLWKEDNRIKANYELVNGERFGLIGLKKCFTVIAGTDEIE